MAHGRFPPFPLYGEWNCWSTSTTLLGCGDGAIALKLPERRIHVFWRWNSKLLVTKKKMRGGIFKKLRPVRGTGTAHRKVILRQSAMSTTHELGQYVYKLSVPNKSKLLI